MALFKKEYSTWKVDLGDPSVASELGGQLVVTDDELLAAINMENLSDRLFARVLRNRSKAHAKLLDKIPAAKEE